MANYVPIPDTQHDQKNKIFTLIHQMMSNPKCEQQPIIDPTHQTLNDQLKL